MKSFHLYLRDPVTSPERFVTDYTPEEAAAFREQFRPLAQVYRQRSRKALYGMVPFFVCLILAITVQKQLAFYFFVAGMCSLFFMVFASPRTPDCPACHIKLDREFGAFCPECGSRSLQPANWFRWSPRCESCRKTMARGKGRYYKIRACTHCGIMLDEKGL